MSRNPFKINKNFSKRRSVESKLSWDEAALDSQTTLHDYKSSDSPEIESKFSIPSYISVGVLLIMFVMVGRLFQLQVVEGLQLQSLAENNRLRKQSILAPRGNIIDRTGAVIARNNANFRLVAIPADLSEDKVAESVNSLSSLLRLDSAEMMKVVDKINYNSFEQVVVYPKLTQAESILFETHSAEFPGFQVASVPIRDYPESMVFSHLIGYSGIISDNELAEKRPFGYEPIDYIGKSGIEFTYEDYLRGQNGYRQVEVDASSHPIKVLGEKQPEAGNEIQLNINAGLQDALYKAFKSRGENIKGAAIALNPKNGEVLALISLPGYDTNLFAQGIKSKEYADLINDKKLPLFNRAIAGSYPPGSTVKPMTALAALEAGIVEENTIIVDRGLLTIPNQYNPSITYKFYGWKRDGLGPMNVKSAIAESSDIYFYTVGGGHPSSDINGLGADALAEYYKKFHIGKLSGIDLQGEKTGLVPDPAWKSDYFAGDAVMSKWYLGDTYHVSIGQGNMLTTPLDVALWTSAIANNGIAYKPKILQKVIAPNGEVIKQFEAEQLYDVKASQKNLDIVKAGMRQTVTAGSGRKLNGLSMNIAGKTGTSQFDGADLSRTHAWFTSYAPYEDPQIVLTVLVEAGGGGDEISVPIANDVYKWCIENNCLNQ